MKATQRQIDRAAIWRRLHPEKNRETQRRNYRKDPSKYRNRQLRSHYGITLNEYEQLFKSQNGECYICGDLPNGRALSVDHEHVNGFSKMSPAQKKLYIRGLLCHRCNRLTMAGKVTVETFERATEYVKRYLYRKVWSR